MYTLNQLNPDGTKISALAFNSVHFRRPSAKICELQQVSYLNQNITVGLMFINISLRYQTISLRLLILYMIPKTSVG